ncbi:MAG: 50S ribosomal protein L25/general stress protein Ctc [Bacteroidia bacterium]
MKSLTITGTKRTELSKQAVKKLRKQENIPCVLYGGKENVNFSSHALNFRPLVYSGNVHTVQLSIDGTEYNAIMKEIQFHPITDKIIHIDFYEIHPDKEVVIDIPVRLKGTPEGVKQGGQLIQKIKKVKISALPVNLPDSIELEITPLTIGDSIRVNNLKKEGVTFLDLPNNIVVGVRTARTVIEEEVPVAATGAVAGAAPAVPGAAAPVAGAAAAPAAPAAAAKTPEKK